MDFLFAATRSHSLTPLCVHYLYVVCAECIKRNIYCVLSENKRLLIVWLPLQFSVSCRRALSPETLWHTNARQIPTFPTFWESFNCDDIFIRITTHFDHRMMHSMLSKFWLLIAIIIAMVRLMLNDFLNKLCSFSSFSLSKIVSIRFLSMIENGGCCCLCMKWIRLSIFFNFNRQRVNMRHWNECADFVCLLVCVCLSVSLRICLFAVGDWWTQLQEWGGENADAKSSSTFNISQTQCDWHLNRK